MVRFNGESRRDDFFSFSVSRLLWALCDIRINCDKERDIWLWKVLRNGVSAVFDAVRLEPCFYVVLRVWSAFSATGWYDSVSSSAGGLGDFPFAVAGSSYGSLSLCLLVIHRMGITRPRRTALNLKQRQTPLSLSPPTWRSPPG